MEVMEERPTLEDLAAEAAQDPVKGLVCSNCGCTDFRVWMTRPGPNNSVRRVRYCRHCGRQIYTKETIVGGPQ